MEPVTDQSLAGADPNRDRKGAASAARAPAFMPGAGTSPFLPKIVRRAGQRWVLLDPAAHELLADGAPDWFNLGGDGRATLIKRNPKRTVHRVEFAGRILYVKQSRGGSAIDRLRQWLFSSPARDECRVAAYASAHGVPAVSFYGRASSAAGSAVLTISPEAADAASLMDAFILDTTGPRQGQGRSPNVDAGSARTGVSRTEGDLRRCNELLSAAAELIAKAHNAAFLHPDNHPGNILVQFDSADQPHCLYADLYGVRIGRPVTQRDAARNLAAINQWFSQRATRTQRLRAFCRYAALRTPRLSKIAAKRLLQLTLRESTRHAHALYRKRDSRIGRDNAYFTTVPLPDGWHAWITLRHRPASLIITDPAPPSTQDDARHFVESRLHINPQSSQPTLIDHADTERVYPPSAWSALCWRITGSPAMKRYRTTMQISHRDLPCQSAIACLEHHRGTGIDQSAWITATLRNATPITQWLANPANASLRRQVLEQAGRLLAHTFDRGIVPTGNIIVSLVIAHTTNGQPIAAWSGLPAQTLRKPVPESVRFWFLSRTSNELNTYADGNRIGTARALRAYCRRAGRVQIGTGWRTIWRSSESRPKLVAAANAKRSEND